MEGDNGNEKAYGWGYEAREKENRISDNKKWCRVKIRTWNGTEIKRCKTEITYSLMRNNTKRSGNNWNRSSLKVGARMGSWKLVSWYIIVLRENYGF